MSDAWIIFVVGCILSVLCTGTYLIAKDLSAQEEACAARGGVPVAGYFTRYCFAKESLK